MTEAERKKLLTMRNSIRKKLTSMELKLKDKAVDKPNATLMQKAKRIIGNSLIDFSRSLNQANPSYKSLEKKLFEINDKMGP